MTAAALILIGGCPAGSADVPEAERAAVVAAVDSATRAFEAAQRARDAEAAIDLLAPGFFMYSDGVRTSYDSVTASIRRSMASVRFLEPGFSDLRVRALSRTAALASFAFRDSIVTHDGTVLRFSGATTLLWELRGGRWLMTYGHADHRAVP